MVLRRTWPVRLSRTKWPRMVKRIGSLWTEMAAQVGSDGDDMVDAWPERGARVSPSLTHVLRWLKLRRAALG